MKISIIGMGRVGCTTAGCLAFEGHNVTGIDNDEDIISELNNHNLPFHEYELENVIKDIRKFSSDYSSIKDSDVTFICTPTKTVPHVIEKASEYTSNLICIRSTVSPGTTKSLDVIIDNNIAVNPEFLAEGTAVKDFLKPDRVVLGVNNDEDYELLSHIYSKISDDIIRTSTKEAEMIKHASNAMLASKLSVINEISNICKEIDVNSINVLDVVGMDDRIENKYMNPGIGWGGSCFQKDITSLIDLAHQNTYNPELLKSVVNVNDKQIFRTIKVLSKHVEINNSKIAVLGLSFKSETDDTRNSRGVELAKRLQDMGATVTTYDPVVSIATQNIQSEFTMKDALEECNAAVIATDWSIFSTADYSVMSDKIVIDGRGIPIKDDLDVYEGVCW